MNISDIITEQNIVIGLKSDTKKALFTEIVQNIRAINPELDEESTLAALWKREALFNTKIAAGIALPHAQISKLAKTIGFLCIVPQGIDYGLSHGEKVNIIFMLLDDDSDTKGHLNTLSNFSRLAKNKDFVASLCAATTARAAFDIIRRFEAA